MARSARFLALSLATTLLLACGEQAEVVELGPPEKPAEHDTLATPSAAEAEGPRQVVVPAALRGKYTRATMTVQLPGMATAATIELPLNGVPQATDYGTLLVRDYLPAFMINGNTITSDGLEEQNPALWAEWQRDGKPVFAGWLFRDYPTLNPMALPEHQLTFIAVNQE
ncbi:MAG: hypothetical protein OQL08_04805 [Gammaproteobacteria bacterium]|nr:hypothetical protein [Gammaproteobacteria bacterium]